MGTAASGCKKSMRNSNKQKLRVSWIRKGVVQEEEGCRASSPLARALGGEQGHGEDGMGKGLYQVVGYVRSEGQSECFSLPSTTPSTGLEGARNKFPV